jgi:fumarylacetoacetase
MRSFLEDGDEVTMRAWCEAEGAARIGFGECVGRVTATGSP